MRIGIDISQLAYPATGVANYLESLVAQMIKSQDHEFILFFSSLRGHLPEKVMKKLEKNKNAKLKKFNFPPTMLDLFWNKLHIMPIERLIGKVDIFITSDWTEPPVVSAKKATILYDLIVYLRPEETSEVIIKTQKRKLKWVKRESDMVFCISEATKNDAKKILGLNTEKLTVIYPGLTL